MKKNILICCVLTGIGLSGCLGEDTSAKGPACHNDIEPGEVQDFGEELPTGSEGLIFGADRNLYVSLTGGSSDILRISPEGVYTVVAEPESALGMATDGNDLIVAAISTGELLRVNPESGDVSVIGTGLGHPNFVLPTPWDTWLVSDDSEGITTISEVTDNGDVSIWFDGVSTPNGMAFSPDGSALYVAQTFADVGVSRVRVQGRDPLDVDLFIPLDAGSTPDGMATDSAGNIYVALNTGGEIRQIHAEGTTTLIADDMLGAASMAFGVGEFDPCSLYVSALLGTQMWRVGIGEAALGLP